MWLGGGHAMRMSGARSTTHSVSPPQPSGCQLSSAQLLAHLLPDVVHPEVVTVEVAVLSSVEAQALASRLLELRLGCTAAHLLRDGGARQQPLLLVLLLPLRWRCQAAAAADNLWSEQRRAQCHSGAVTPRLLLLLHAGAWLVEQLSLSVCQGLQGQCAHTNHSAAHHMAHCGGRSAPHQMVLSPLTTAARPARALIGRAAAPATGCRRLPAADAPCCAAHWGVEEIMAVVV